MIEAVNTVRSVPLSNIMKVRHFQDRISLPLEGGGVVFARLKHVTGVPVSGDGRGFSFSRLQALDTLIDNLARVRNIRGEALSRGESPADVDVLVEKYSRELHRALARPEPYFQKSAPGVFFQLSA